MGNPRPARDLVVARLSVPTALLGVLAAGCGESTIFVALPEITADARGLLIAAVDANGRRHVEASNLTIDRDGVRLDVSGPRPLTLFVLATTDELDALRVPVGRLDETRVDGIAIPWTAGRGWRAAVDDAERPAWIDQPILPSELESFRFPPVGDEGHYRCPVFRTVAVQVPTLGALTRPVLRGPSHALVATGLGEFYVASADGTIARVDTLSDAAGFGRLAYEAMAPDGAGGAWLAGPSGRLDRIDSEDRITEVLSGTTGVDKGIADLAAGGDEVFAITRNDELLHYVEGDLVWRRHPVTAVDFDSRVARTGPGRAVAVGERATVHRLADGVVSTATEAVDGSSIGAVTYDEGYGLATAGIEDSLTTIRFGTPNALGSRWQDLIAATEVHDLLWRADAMFYFSGSGSIGVVPLGGVTCGRTPLSPKPFLFAVAAAPHRLVATTRGERDRGANIHFVDWD